MGNHKMSHLSNNGARLNLTQLDVILFVPFFFIFIWKELEMYGREIKQAFGKLMALYLYLRYLWGHWELQRFVWWRKKWIIPLCVWRKKKKKKRKLSARTKRLVHQSLCSSCIYPTSTNPISHPKLNNNIQNNNVFLK